MKYHICREKMQLSRAKPGNPASSSINSPSNGSPCSIANYRNHTDDLASSNVRYDTWYCITGSLDLPRQQ